MHSEKYNLNVAFSECKQNILDFEKKQFHERLQIKSSKTEHFQTFQISVSFSELLNGNSREEKKWPGFGKKKHIQKKALDAHINLIRHNKACFISKKRLT